MRFQRSVIPLWGPGGGGVTGGGMEEPGWGFIKAPKDLRRLVQHADTCTDSTSMARSMPFMVQPPSL